MKSVLSELKALKDAQTAYDERKREIISLVESGDLLSFLEELEEKEEKIETALWKELVTEKNVKVYCSNCMVIISEGIRYPYCPMCRRRMDNASYVPRFRNDLEPLKEEALKTEKPKPEKKRESWQEQQPYIKLRKEAYAMVYDLISGGFSKKEIANHTHLNIETVQRIASDPNPSMGISNKVYTAIKNMHSELLAYLYFKKTGARVSVPG